METKELDNLSRDELFEKLKGMSKSILKRDLYCWLICWILVLPLLFFSAQRLLDEPMSIPYFIIWMAIVCFGGWSLLFIFRSLMKVDKLDTPERLLYWFYRFEKSPRYSLIFWLVLCLFITRHSSLPSHVSGFEDYLVIVVGFVIIALIFFRGAPWLLRKEKDIIEQLIELVKKK